ncbi:MAG: presqualene diphosphate synthase HpnD [Gammaproteobacteria bacterium]|nr:presqualene diphosphate synthase HpnD [Gammaproteobacteria bacterium]
MTPDEYCQQKASSSGSSFYYSFLFLPEVKRRAIVALYAFCREVDDIVDELDDKKRAAQKLDGWRDEINRLYHATPQHPVTQALVLHLKQFNLAEEYFYEIIDGMEMDLSNHTYQNFSELSLYCYRVASVVGLLSAEIFGYSNRNTLKYANDLGMAFQLTNILRDVKEDADRGRIYIPHNEMLEYGVTADMLKLTHTTQSMRNLFRQQARRANEYYVSALNCLPNEDRYAQRAGLIMAAIYKKILYKIERKNYCVLERRINIPVWQKLWIAMRTYQQEKKLSKSPNR